MASAYISDFPMNSNPPVTISFARHDRMNPFTQGRITVIVSRTHSGLNLSLEGEGLLSTRFSDGSIPSLHRAAAKRHHTSHRKARS